MSTQDYKTTSVNQSQRAKDFVVNGIKVNEIIDVLEGLGYNCETSSQISGESGYKQGFDIVAERESETIVLDIVSYRTSILDVMSDDEIYDQISLGLLRMRAKSVDCKPSLSGIIHLCSYFSDTGDSRLSNYDPLQQLSDDFKIKIIRSATISGAAKGLSGLLTSKEVVSEYGA